MMSPGPYLARNHPQQIVKVFIRETIPTDHKNNLPIFWLAAKLQAKQHRERETDAIFIYDPSVYLIVHNNKLNGFQTISQL